MGMRGASRIFVWAEQQVGVVEMKPVGREVGTGAR